MKMYLLSFAAGVLVGIVYGLLNVNAPAPPVVALVGLAGILIGEQAIPVGRQMLSGKSLFSACAQKAVLDHIFGQLPGRRPAEQTNQIAEETHS